MSGADPYGSYIVSQVKSLRGKLSKEKRVRGPFVTISRQTGAYGVSIAKDLSEYLQKYQKSNHCLWTVFDKELIEKVAQEHDLPERVLPYMSEETVSDIQGMVEEILGLHPAHDLLVFKTNKTILHLAQLGYSIIVGRGASIITSNMPGGVHVRLVSPMEKRLLHVREYYKLTAKEAKQFIISEDRKRSNYVKKYFGKNIDDPLLYDLIINVDALGLQETIGLIANLVIGREEKL